MNIDFKALCSLSPNPYMLLDRDLTIVWTNAAYLRATMHSAETLFGRHLLDAFPSEPGSESYELLFASFERVLESREVDEIALIRYDIPRPDGTMETRYWSATHTPMRDAAGEVEFILQHTVDVTELHNLRTMRDEIDMVRRAQAVQDRNLDLQGQIERLTRLFEQAPGFVCVLTGESHVFEMANSAYCDLVGRTDLIGKPVVQALPEIEEQGFVAILDEVRRTRQPYVGKARKVYFDADPGALPVHRCVDFVFQPVILDGAVSAIFVQGQDVTEAVEAARHQDLLINELNHRVKNTLAIVQSLASQSFRKVEAAAEARLAFDERLHALAGAHNLLTDANWGTTSLGEVVRAATAAAGDPQRLRASGPVIALPPRLTVALSMTLHELTTNAIKYGALSNETGTVAVTWSRQTGQPDRLVLEWQEFGGPRVETPTRKGFGTALIERGLAAEDGGQARIAYLPEGLTCSITLYLPPSEDQPAN
ncbi:PAS domain-containing protein [Novosphingobium profundi]|uniref:sensor histidine kinase n=1 Tax=Novosphingobium profundi TaxID=1774954 RepID=UPI001BDA0944|nr:HWE histidine kinase domain-containing protein [Novosphingobium profundi]MBT0670986.1 PAS domain-containing protein [Novosphingobium profundi]